MRRLFTIWSAIEFSDLHKFFLGSQHLINQLNLSAYPMNKPLVVGAIGGCCFNSGCSLSDLANPPQL